MRNFIIIISTFLSMHTQAQQSNTHFSHTIETTASADKIWQIWTDVSNWKNWDDGLKTAVIQGGFVQNTEGVLTPDKGPKSKFKITEIIPNQSYTFRTKLPLGSLYVKRFLSFKDGKTLFTHEVWFTGILKGVFGRALGRNYRKILPDVMNKIKILAEK